MLSGLQKTSLIDYPGKVSCVAFFAGCNLCCPYCHNPELARGRSPGHIGLKEFVEFLTPRCGLIEGVVLSGGEPTLSPDLEDVCSAVHQVGLPVKLDTNGTRPHILERLIERGMVDYIAMDLKTVPSRYAPFLAAEDVGALLTQSIRLIMQGNVDYEFRTTCVRPFVDEEMIAGMAGAIQDARLYVLQAFKPRVLLRPAFFSADPGFSRQEMERLSDLAAPWVQKCLLRA
jgi:pyruvate formate lyase activating enzyme